MRIAVLSSPSSWYFADLQRGAGEGDELVCLPFSELSAAVGGARRVASRETCLDALDGVLVRSMPRGSLEQVVFRMDALAQLEQSGIVVLNPPKGIETAVDKYLTTLRLDAAGLLTPRTVTCQTRAAALNALDELGGDVVLKPLFGGEGRGVARLTDPDVAERAFSLLEGLGGVIYLQEFIAHRGFDMRLLVIGDRVLGMKRVHADDWRTNISRGARAEPLEVTSKLGDLALRAARAVGAPLAGVDVLPGVDGRLYTIEVNAVPGWRALTQVTGVDVAKLVLQFMRKCRR